MRKGIILSIVFMLFSSNTLAHDVFPDSNGNTLNIRINNTSNAFSMPQVRVTKQSLPSWITGFSPNEVNLGNIATTHSATATFTFNIAAGASIGASENIRFQVNAGSGDSWSKNVSLRVINPHGAISGDVNVEGIIANPSGAILTATGPVSRTITLDITGWYTIDNLPAGNYTVTVSKPGYTPVPASRNVPVNLGQTTPGVDFVLIRPPQPPTLRSPSNNSTVNTPGPKLDWNTAQGGGHKKYRIQVDTNSNFTQPIIDVSNITDTDYTPGVSLVNTTTYYWRVRTSNEAGISEWSNVWNFKTSILPAKPTLISPSNESTISSLQPSFDWNDAAYATSYRIQVANNSDFSSPVIDKSGLTGSSYNHTSNLSVNTKYYWRVRASNVVGNGDWSNSWWFKTPSLPSTPSLSSPSNGKTITDTDDVTLSWSSVSNASSYRIQVDNNSDFSSPEKDSTEYSTSYTAWDLNNNTTYYWRVRASNSIGNSSWSSGWWFKIDLKGKIKGDVAAEGILNTSRGAILSVSGPVNRTITLGITGWYTVDDLPPGNYTVTVSKPGYTPDPPSHSVYVGAGETVRNVDFILRTNRVNAAVVLSSPSAIRNASAYSSYVKALRSMALENSRGTSSLALLSLTTPVTPVLSSGEVSVLVNTSRPVPEVPFLSYTVEGEKPEKVELRGSGSNFTGQMYIESTTPEGTATFHYYAVDESGSVSTHIEYGQEFVIDTTIYADEGGQVSNRDGAGARVSRGALPVAVNITITSPQSPGGPQRSLANNLSLPLEINDIPYVPLLDSMRQFCAQIDGKQPPHRGRRVSTLNEVVDEIKGVTISLPYLDQDQDGIVDNVMLDEESLKILQLRNGSWEVIEDCEIDKERNIVSAQVSAFTTFMLTGAKVIVSVENIISYPNPWYPERDNYVKITFIPLNSQPKVYIYNIAGELVRTLRDGQEIISTGQGYMEASWDGKNDSGSTVSYGVYIYVVECNKGTKKGKIGIIR
ncbi:MAG: carboxypeptidase regulatory-like domain-containing protein [bacterium]|nr:carboxypeptidase regulatory-like domain-containing protein [bacterium]